MPFLNWRSRAIRCDVSPSPLRGGYGQQVECLRISIGEADSRELVVAWKQCFADLNSEELRLDLPDSFTLFCKARPEENRLLLAHPELGSWVGSLMLTPESAACWLEGFRATESLREDFVSWGFPVHGVSNLDLAFRPQ